VISTGGRLDVRTYEAGEGRKKEQRLAFEIQYPTFLETARAAAPVAPVDEDAPADDATPADAPAVDSVPWEE
jgi:hypothetical protein